MTVDRYAVVGHPIAHSRSPFIHTLFAEQTGQSLRYEAIDIAPDVFDEQVLAFRDSGVRGLNVTLPLKELAYRLADRLSDRAASAGAVNTLIFSRDGSIDGDNTDGIGLVRDLVDNLGWPLTGQRTLLLGAGGAARGVLAPLLASGMRSLVIANRTVSKGEALAAEFRRSDMEIEACGFDGLGAIEPVNLIINATSAGLHGDVLRIPVRTLTKNARVYDMIYAPEDTPFLASLAEYGVLERADGRGMLVEQAAESFFLWRGVTPDTAPVIRALGEALRRA